MKNPSPVIVILIIIVILSLAILGVYYLQNIVPGTFKPEVSGSDSKNAIVRCTEVLKASLRNAEKAKFSNQKVNQLGNNRYQIIGNVDAPNASGIIVKGNYNCIFNFNTKSFDLLSLEGDDVWKPLKK